MKIIGTTPRGYLVEAMSDELLEISGRDDRVQKALGYDWRPKLDAVGLEFNVNGAWRRLGDIRQREGQMRQTAASLRALADLIDGKLDFVKEPDPAAKASTDA